MAGNIRVYKHQIESTKYAIKNKYCILALEGGLGKTKISIDAAVATKSKTLIVCPSYLRYKWKHEIDKWAPGSIVSLFKTAKDFYEVYDSDYVIIGYSMVHLAKALFEWADLVIADEAQNLKSMTTQRSEAFHRLIYEYSIKRCLLLTGTPVQNRLYELYSLMAVCNYNPEKPESAFLLRYPTYVDFAMKFCFKKQYDIVVKNRRRTVTEYHGARNLHELDQWLEGIFIGYKAEDVLDLPPHMHIDVPVAEIDMPELMIDFESFIKENKNTNPEIKKRAAMLTAPFTVEYAQNLLENECKQIVIFTDHVESAEYIAKKMGVKAITGKTDMLVRDQMAIAFMEGRTNKIVATIGSMSTGVDLYAAADIVFNDPNYVPGVMEQAYWRIKRIGQKQTCRFHHMIGTLQGKHIRKILQEKIDTIQQLNRYYKKSP